MQLEDLFGNKKILLILKYLVDHEDVLQRELVQKTKISKATVIKWLYYLEKNGFITRKTIGSSRMVNINNDNGVITELKKINILMGLSDIKKPENSEVYLYGSCARGDYSTDSDMDLLIIGKARRTEIIRDMESLERKMGRRISFNIFTDLEWSKMAKQDKAFYERVEKDKVRLV